MGDSHSASEQRALTFLTELRDVYNLCGKLVAGCHFDALSDDAERAPGGRGGGGRRDEGQPHHMAPASSHHS